MICLIMEYGFYFEGEEINASVNQFNAALLGSIFLFQQLFLKQVRNTKLILVCPNTMYTANLF